MEWRGSIVVVAALLFPAGGLLADLISFRDGTTVEARVLSISRTHVFARVDGRFRTFSKQQIRAIEQKPLSRAAQLKEITVTQNIEKRRTKSKVRIPAGTRAPRPPPRNRPLGLTGDPKK